MKNRSLKVAAASLLALAALSLMHAFGAFARIDPAASAYLTAYRPEGVTRMLVILTEIAGPAFIAALTLGLGAVLAIERKRRAALLLFLSSGIGLALFSALKLAFRASRPEGGLVAVGTFSFPSGHATMATIFFVLLSHAFDSVSKSESYRRLFRGLCLALLLAVSLSRIYLGVHWPSDVLAGIALGAFSLSLSEAFVVQDKHKFS